MRESVLLEHIRQRSAPLHGRGAVVVGPGDDCAVLALPGLTLATVDHLVEGRHYDTSLPVDRIARKGIARSVSDIAAMGGEPLCGLATGCLRDGFEHADELFDRMAYWANEFGCPLAGGDIAFSPGPTVLTVTVLGRPHHLRGPVERSTASEGDKVCVTGALGNSYPSGRHADFEPRIREARDLCTALGHVLTSMIDVSDGLGRDAGRLAAASRARIEIDSWRIPLAAGTRSWRNACTDGEDYELLFTVKGDARLPGDTVSGTPVTVIGRVVRGNGCVAREQDGTVHQISDLGWDHGAGSQTKGGA